MAELILNYITGIEFHTKLYPNDSEDSRTNRLKFILDLYLNTPDKGVRIGAFPHILMFQPSISWFLLQTYRFQTDI